MKTRKTFLSIGRFKVPGGWCAAAWTERGLCVLTLPAASAARSLALLKAHFRKSPIDSPLQSVPGEVRRFTLAALKGKGSPRPKLDLSLLTPFQRRILHATCKVPLGETRSYAWAAKRAGRPEAYRAAGQALNRNPVPLLVPCHRILEGNGGLGGFGGGLAWKKRLLRAEGALG